MSYRLLSILRHAVQSTGVVVLLLQVHGLARYTYELPTLASTRARYSTVFTNHKTLKFHSVELRSIFFLSLVNLVGNRCEFEAF